MSAPVPEEMIERVIATRNLEGLQRLKKRKTQIRKLYQLETLTQTFEPTKLKFDNLVVYDHSV